MTSPPRRIDVKCPKCHTFFETYHKASINLKKDNFDKKYIEKISIAKCPNCKFKISLDTLVVRKDGTWQID